MGQKRPVTMTEAALADHWGMTPRHVRNFASEGVAVRLDSGEYDVLESDANLIAWLRRDEPTRRTKRELMRAQIQEREQRMQRHDREHLTLEEVRGVLEAGWGELWKGHGAALNHVWGDVSARMGEREAAQFLGSLEQRVKGELNLCRQRIEELTKRAAERLTLEQRNGIIVATREIERLEDAVGKH